MSLSVKVACLPWSPPSRLGFGQANNDFSYLGVHGVSTSFSSSNRNRFRRLFSLNSDDIDVHGLPNAKSFNPEQEGSTGSQANGQGVARKSNEMAISLFIRSMDFSDGDFLIDFIRIVEKLRRYGIAGVLSYGLLNTAYYLTTFLVVWFYVAPAPGKLGYLAAVERFLKVMAMVWAGSQVTKILRAGGALALAPFVESGLSWFTVKFKFGSQGQAFMAIVAFCLGLAIMLFFSITLLWA